MLCAIDMKATGEQIEKLRKQTGYSVKELQRAMDPISCQAIYKWQQGMALPTIDNLVILSDLFQVPMDQIIVREGGAVRPLSFKPGAVTTVLPFKYRRSCDRFILCIQ